MEMLDLYDRNRRALSKAIPRGQTPPEGAYFLAADAYFLDDQGRMLIQKRSDTKDVLPGIWADTGGAAISGEDTKVCIAREVREELGFDPDFSKGRLLLSNTSDERHMHKDVYLFFQTVPIEKMRLQKEEVQEARWVYPEEIQKNEAYRADFAKLRLWPALAPAIGVQSARIRVPIGIYRHYKGGRYQVLDAAIHSETLEPMVIYRALYGTFETWVRPFSMWHERVTVNGAEVARFTLEPSPSEG